MLGPAVAQRRVVIAAGVDVERIRSGGSVINAADVAVECLMAGGSVVVAAGVAIGGLKSQSCVAVGRRWVRGAVRKEGRGPQRRVVNSLRVVKERFQAHRRVVRSCSVGAKSGITGADIARSGHG